VVLKVDRFGNLITNITPQDVPKLFDADPPAFKIAIGTKPPATRICANYAEGSPARCLESWQYGFSKWPPSRSAFQLLEWGKGSPVNVVMEGR